MNINTFIYGYGSIGQELVSQVRERGWNVSYIAKSDGVYTLDSEDKLVRVGSFSEHTESFSGVDLSDISIVFLAIPRSSRGRESRKLAVVFARMQIPIVTCEKSLLAYYPSYLDSIGHTASVGGGSHLLPFIKEQVRIAHDVKVDIVLNATLNFIMSAPEDMESAADKAVELHYAEPGQSGLLQILNSEIADTVLKTCIVICDCFLPERIVDYELALEPDSIIVQYLSEADLERLRADKQSRRYIVSISMSAIVGQDETIGGFHFKTINGWFVSAGFKKISDDKKLTWFKSVGGTNNAALISTSYGQPCYVVGPGAGPFPTARTMMQDAVRILEIN